jgi:hypothetical protein
MGQETITLEVVPEVMRLTLVILPEVMRLTLVILLISQVVIPEITIQVIQVEILVRSST